MALHFTVVSDTHYFSKKLGTEGKAYELDNQKSQKLLADSGDVLRAAFAQIAKDGRSDIVLLSGDLVNNGEMVSHEEMQALLRELRGAGKRVFAITSTHDYDEGCEYIGDKKVPTAHAERDTAFEIYREFGYDQALAVHEPSHCYAAQLAPGYRVLALNDDQDGTGHSGFSDECLDWIHGQIEQAKAAGDMLIPMTHHPMIAPSPFYAIIGKGDMMHRHEKIRALFADWGLPFCFTGHTHIQDISFCFSDAGHVFYDVSTPSLVGYPGTFRHAVADKEHNSLAVTTEHITEPLPFDLRQRMEEQFFGMIRDVIAAAASDIPRFAEMARAFSIKPKVSYKFGWLLKPAAKWLTKLRIGKVAKWVKKETGLRPADYAEIADKKVTDFIISLVMHLFGGDAPYTPDTPKYKITIGLLNVIDSLLRTVGVKFSVRKLVEPLLYNAGICDDNAVLPLGASKEQAAALCPQYEETVRESRKGPGILAAAIAAVLVLLPFLPLAALLLGLGFLVNYIRFGKQIRG